MPNQIPTEKWRGALTVARELELVEVYNDYLLVSKPVDELKSLRGEKWNFYNREQFPENWKLNKRLNFL